MEFKTSARVFAVTAGLGFALVGVPVVALADDAVALPEGTTVVTVDMTTETAQPEKNDAVAEEVAAPSVDEYVNKDQAAPDNSKSDAVEQPSDGVTDAIPSTKDGTPDVSDGADKNEEPAGKDDPSVKVSDSEQPSAGTVSDPAFKDGQLSESTDSSVSDANPSSNKTTGWSKDGNSYSDGTGKAYTGWVIDDHAGNGLQRWYVKNGLLFRDGLFESNDAAWGSGWAFARADTGYVVRGKYIDPLTGFVYLADNNGKLLAPGWQVSSDFGDGLQRYYIESGSHACEPGRSDNGWAHYTTKQGYVVRGKHDDAQGHVWLADNDGKLESTKGWLVTTKYDGGGINWQRYYMCSGEFAGSAKSARFYATDEHGVQAFYFGMAFQGYVLRGFGLGTSMQDFVYANNDGHIAKSTWMVTDQFGQGLQRYWFDSGAWVARNRLVTAEEGAGWYAWATDKGYVLRGKMDAGNGYVYLANNDGKLESGDANGWLVTGAYSGGPLQRYYIDPSMHAAKTGFFNVGNSAYYGLSGTGYVLRGKKKTNEGIVLADNDGRLNRVNGWFVSAAYDGGAQRYFMVSTGKGYSVAKTGFFKASMDGFNGQVNFYGNTDTGYVVRGKHRISAGMLLANNEGVLLDDLNLPGKQENAFFVTTYFDGGAQRYYLIKSDGHLLAKVGKFTVGGKDYYGREDQGYVVRGFYSAPDGSSYYGNNDGVLQKIGWYNDGGVWCFLSPNGNIIRSNAAYSAWNTIRNWSSETSYLICIDNTNCRTIIFQGSAGNWIPVSDNICSVGVNKTVGNDVFGQTVRGVFKIQKKGLMMGNDPDYYYWSEFFCPGGYAEGQRFHSVGYYRRYGTDYTNPDNRGPQFDKGIGTAETHGCVRLLMDAVKFIYDNCPIGTLVYSY